MVKHVVCHKYQDKADAEKVAEMLRNLMGVVPTLRSMEVGIDFMESERSFDLVLIATFDDEAGLKAYDQHPEHQKVRAFVSTRKKQVISVDFHC